MTILALLSLRLLKQKRSKKISILAALAVSGRLQLAQAERPDIDMSTTVMAAASKTEFAKEVEDKLNMFIVRNSAISKENLGIIAAVTDSAIRQEISTYQLQNNNFSYEDYKMRMDARYSIKGQDGSVSFSIVKEF